MMSSLFNLPKIKPRIVDQAPEAVTPGPVYDGDPGSREMDTIGTNIRNRMLARSVRGPQNDPENTSDQQSPHGSNGGVALAVGVGVGWDGNNRRARQVGGHAHRRHDDVVRYHRTIDARSGVLATDGLVYIRLQHPALDKIWEMRAVILTYQDPWTVGPTGSQAAIFVGQPGVGAKVSDLILMGIAIPASVTWSHDQQIVYGGQELYVAINNPGANPGLYQAQADVCEYDLMLYRKRWL